MPNGHWVQNDQNVRKFFDEFAESRNFDALAPRNWYSVLGSDIRATQVLFPVLESTGI